MSRTKRNRAEQNADDILPTYLTSYACNYYGDRAAVYAVEYALSHFGTSDVELARECCIRMHFTENAKYLAPKYQRDDFNLHERRIRAALRTWRSKSLRVEDYDQIDEWLDISHRHISGFSL